MKFGVSVWSGYDELADLVIFCLDLLQDGETL